MKKIICLFLCLLFVFITGCSPKAEHNSSESIKESTSSNTEQNIAESTDGGFYISEALDITNIIRLIPLNEREIYVIGAKRDKAFEQREIVYGVLNIEEKESAVLHREFTSVDGAENSAVQINSDGLTEFFTGQKILVFDGYNLVDTQPVAVDKKESFVDLKQKKLAVIENESLILYLKSLAEGDEKQTAIYKPEKRETDGKEYILFPFSPKIKIYENRIIYGVAEDNTMNYKKIVVSDFDGKVIGEIGDLEIRADNIFFYFSENGFVTVETSDHLTDGTEKEVTFFAEYSEEGKIISEQTINGVLLDGQEKMFDGCSLYAYAYAIGSDSGVAVYDFYNKTAYRIKAADGYVISPTVTPSGKRVVWANGGAVFFEDINDLEAKEIIEAVK